MNENAKNALIAYREKLASGEIAKPTRKNPLEKALANPTSLKLAIRAACWDCVGGDVTENWQNEIRLCTINKCGLHHVRPYNE